MIIRPRTDNLEHDSRRPTKHDPESKTGWIAYYVWDRSESGSLRPNYLFRPDLKVEDLYSKILERIAHEHEQWMIHAERSYMIIHYGVTPPLDLANKELKRIQKSLDNLLTDYQNLKSQIDAREGRGFKDE